MNGENAFTFEHDIRLLFTMINNELAMMKHQR